MAIATIELRAALTMFVRRIWACCFIVFVCALGICHATPVSAAADTAPEVAVRQFYAWYLQQLSASKDPLHDEPATYAKYVSRELAAEIEAKLHSADGMDADYFIQAQDFEDDWKSNISTTASRVNGGSASTVVSLGATKPPNYRLLVTLVNQKGVWKIRQVSRLRS